MASPAAAPPSKKERFMQTVSLVGLTQDILFEDENYDPRLTMARNINNMVADLGDEASFIKSSLMVANYIDPAVQLPACLPDPEGKLANALYICNAITTWHLAKLDRVNASLRQTNRALLQEKMDLEETASLRLVTHSLDGRNDYDKLRRQLSEERESHVAEIKDIQRNNKSQLEQIIAEKEELRVKDKEIRDSMALCMQDNFNQQLAMVQSTHDSVVTFLKSSIDDLQRSLSSTSSSSATTFPGLEVQDLRKKVDDLQKECDLKDTLVEDLTKASEKMKRDLEALSNKASKAEDNLAVLKGKLDEKINIVTALKTQIADEQNVSISLHGTIESLKKEKEAALDEKDAAVQKMDTTVQEKTDLSSKLDQSEKEVARLSKIETHLKKKQPTPSIEIAEYEETMAKLNDELAEKDKNMAIMEKECVTTKKEVITHKEKVARLQEKMSKLTQEKEQSLKENARLEDEMVQLREELDLSSRKYQNEVVEKENLLQLLEKKEEDETKKTTPDVVSFTRSNLAEVKSEDIHADDSCQKSLSPTGEAVCAEHDDIVEEKQPEKEKKSHFPPYDRNVGYKKSRQEKHSEEVEFHVSDADCSFGNQTDNSEKIEEEYAQVTRRNQRGFKRAKEEERRFKSPSPKEKKTRDGHSSESDRSRSSSLSSESYAKDLIKMTVETAAQHVQEIKQKKQAYTAYLDNNKQFKDFMRSNVSEEEKFVKMEKNLEELLSCNNFHDFKEFVKGNRIGKKKSRVAKGALPDLRENSAEWTFMQQFPEASKKPNNALIHFNNGIVALRPYCEPLYQAMTVLLSAEGEKREATELLFTRTYDKGYSREDDIIRSLEERKFELLSVIAIAKTYFALKKNRDVRGYKTEKIKCDSLPYTKEWAEELSSMTEKGVNHASFRTLMALYVDTRHCGAAVTCFYNDLSKLKDKAAETERKFQW